MNKQTTINAVFERVKADINAGPYPAYNIDFYRGYCAAIEDLNMLKRGDIWHEVRARASALCEEIRGKRNVTLF